MTTERAGAGSLTGYVAEFIATTSFASIPEAANFIPSRIFR